MVSWSDFAEAAPRLAQMGVQRLIEPGVVLVGTVRNDGTPRISPVEPLLWDGDLWLSMLFGSRKAADLRRDPRLVVHSVVTSRDGGPGEFKLRGRAVEVPPGPRHDGYAEQVRNRLGWEPTPGRVHLFRIEVHDVTFIRYDDASGDQFVARWPAGDEFVRRSDGGTALGPAVAHSALLAHGEWQASLDCRRRPSHPLAAEIAVDDRHTERTAVPDLGSVRACSTASKGCGKRPVRGALCRTRSRSWLPYRGNTAVV